jgi:hypothetical protein
MKTEDSLRCSQDLVSFLIQMNSFHIRPFYFLKIHSNIILPSTTSLLHISKQNTVCIFIHSCVLHTLFFSLPFVLCLMRGILHSLNSEYYPKFSFLNHVYITFFLGYRRKGITLTQSTWKFCYFVCPYHLHFGK